MKKSTCHYIVALILFISGTIYTQNYSFAATNSVAVSLQGSVSITCSGSWANGINLSGTTSPIQTSIASWSGNNNVDFITFTDTAQSPGSYIKIYVQNEKFAYSGGGKSNTGLVRGDNLYFETSSNPTKGTDNTSKNINFIGNESCNTANTNNFQLNTDFYSTAGNNRLRLGTGIGSSRVIFRSSAPCTTTVKIFFNSIKLYFPSLTTSGSYTNSLIFLAVDGEP